MIDRARRFVGVVSVDSLKQAVAHKHALDAALLSAPDPIPAQTPVSDLISLVAEAPCPVSYNFV